MTDKACAVCTRRFDTANPAAPLQCRALPPVQGLGRDAIFPTVGADAFCHVYFERDFAAVAERDAARKAAEEEARRDAEWAAPQPELPLAAAESEAVAADAPKRARRARPAGEA